MARYVIALGGNALMEKGKPQSVELQFESAEKALKGIAKFCTKDEIVITHGNGPQVGALMARSENSLKKAYYVPLSICGAQSQGEIGYVLQQTLQNQLNKSGTEKNVVTILTQVECSKDDPALKDPSKPIGMFFGEEKIREWKEKGIEFAEDSGRGYRRVVPSPKPFSIVEKDSIMHLLESGSIVIACGGGGIPVFRNAHGFEAIEGVVDKDYASALLAQLIDADELVILTGVEKVSINFNTPEQKDIDVMTLNEAKDYLLQGQFGKGSMEPKMRAAIEFVEQTGKFVVITSLEKFSDAMQGKAGTRIIP